MRCFGPLIDEGGWLWGGGKEYGAGNPPPHAGSLLLLGRLCLKGKILKPAPALAALGKSLWKVRLTVGAG